MNVDFITSRLPQRSVHEALDNSISREEVYEAVRLLKNSKASGEDGLPNEIWKIGSALSDYLVEVCNHALEGKGPKEWVDCTMTLTTTAELPFVNRRQSLQCGPDTEVAELVPDVAPESQYGCQPGRSTEDLIYMLRQLFEKAWEKNTTMYAILIDFHKAYDSVDRELLWEVLSRFGVPPKCLDALRNLHTNMEGWVAYRGELSSNFPIHTGVRQRSIGGPVLFILFLAAMMEVAFPDNSRFCSEMGVKLEVVGGDITDVRRFRRPILTRIFDCI